MHVKLRTGRVSPPRHELPAAALLQAFADEDPLLLFESALPAGEEEKSLLFRDPERVISTSEPGESLQCLRDLEEAVDSGLWAAGWCAYELGYCFEPALRRRYEGGGPLLWFGLFREPLLFDHGRGTFSRRVETTSSGEATFSHSIEELLLDTGRDEYRRNVEEIMERIGAGDSYQVNYTMRYRFRFEGSPAGLYLSLRDNQPVPYAAFLRSGSRYILSASPELFFRRRGEEITVRPMKGTAPRGLSGGEDLARAVNLALDPKNRAENIMVVDLLRNDLGRICRPGSIEVSDLCAVEPYDTLFQMTTTVRGRLLDGLGPAAILGALLPSGSVTGAPKIRTMEIIAGLERDQRGPYCGAVGFFSPRREAVFNVPIRTVVLEGRRGVMGVGSGIVADSDAAREYEECLLKGRFLTRPRPPLRLVETLRWRKETGFILLEDHLARLFHSALHFGFSFPLEAVRGTLHGAAAGFNDDGPRRVRLLLRRDGSCDVTATPLRPPPRSPRAALSKVQMNSADPHLYHKTTRREVYDWELEAARGRGLFEILFTNEKGELTEGSFTNLFLQRGGRLLTPPVSCGLLDGVLRRHLLRERDGLVAEAVLLPEDLECAERVFVGNSVRGLVEVQLETGEK